MGKRSDQTFHQRGNIQKAYSYMKKSSTSLSIRDIQSKTVMRYHYTPTRIAKIKCDNTKCWQEYRVSRLLTHPWREYKMVQPLQEAIWQFLIQLNIQVPCVSAITFLGIIFSQGNYIFHKSLYTHVHHCCIVLTMHNSENWKQSRCPSVREWVNKLWGLHTTEYYSTIKRNKLFIHTTTWMNLQGIMLCK